MKIYESEVKDGLTESLLKNNTIACCAVAEAYRPKREAVSKLQSVLADNVKRDGLAVAQNEDQMDLYYLKSILVSTGWNKNDDVFEPQELWAARNTPEDKPFNFMHDEKDIIGHITGNKVVDFSGVEMEDVDENSPGQFNILTTAVIYTEWSDPDQRQRMSKIVEEIEDGKWFVSMECLFPDFDYALAKEDGTTSVISRNEASAFLTKHLRSYGGSGKYQDYSVGRLLRNLSFSGKGLVSKPANPRSVILEGSEFFDETKSQVLTISSIKENSMSDNHEKQISDLKDALAEAKASNDALKERVISEQRAEFASKIEELESTVAGQATQIKEQLEASQALVEAAEKHAEALEAKDTKLKEQEEAIAVMEKKEAMLQRKAKLEEAGFDAAEAIATVEEFEAVDEDTFDRIVAIMKRAVIKHDEQPVEECQEEPAQAELEEEQDAAEASEEVLESVEESQEVAIAEAVGSDDPAESLRSVASEWLGSVLQYAPQEDN
jgi:hypothetical protein